MCPTESTAKKIWEYSGTSTPYKGHNSIQRTLFVFENVCFLHTYNTFVTSKSGQPLLKGQKTGPNAGAGAAAAISNWGAN